METIEGLEGVDSQLNDAMANAGAELASAAVWTGVATAVVINVLFIILYNVNLKHLVK